MALANLKGAETTRQDLERGIQASMQGDTNLLAGRNALGGAAIAADAKAQDDQEKKAKREFEDRMYDNLLRRAQDWSDKLGRDIAGMEGEFTREFGDAWREHMAIAILDPEIAQRRDGESVTEYRKRLEQSLKDEMLNADGSIKDEYKSGPYARWAVWAQKQYHKGNVDDYIQKRSDPNASPAERKKLDDDMARSPTGQVMRAELELAQAGQDNSAMTKERDARTDARLTAVTAGATDTSSLNSI